MSNPIIERELVGLLRTKKALWMLVATAAVFALLESMKSRTSGRMLLRQLLPAKIP